MTVMTDDEHHRKSRRRETAIMVVDVAIALAAGASLILWAAGGTVLTPGWLVIAITMAVRNIYAQRTIRLLREAHREAQEHSAWLLEQWHAAVTRIFN
jgi:hypothetical protein